MSLSGKIALVTGSASGIGLAITEHLVKQGSSVIMTGSRSEEVAEQAVDHIRKLTGAVVHYIRCDLREKSQIDQLCHRIEEIYPEGIDILVNNAGVAARGPVPEISYDDWNELMHINLTAPFLLIKHFMPLMKKRKWGRIINISSILGMVASANDSSYVASKHGLVGLTKAVALETAELGITCNAVNVGFTNTPMLRFCREKVEERVGIPPEKTLENTLSMIPTKRIMEPSEIAEYVMFLCSPGADNMTGTAVPIDGGCTAQ